MANNLKRLRKEKTTFTQEEFAKHLGFKYKAYQNWERGVRGMNLGVATIIADFYGVSINDLMGDEKLDSGDEYSDIPNRLRALGYDAAERVIKYLEFEENVGRTNPHVK
ncbi:MAG: helix-turn-helix transcriptional regulator [Actinobacteria bacterium]|nr:helix-turn-helix transcriptional regulator [Actinomycetota bacterium]